MRTVTLTATAALLLASVAGTTAAQDGGAPPGPFIKPPVLLVMPGALTSCAIHCGGGGTRRTDFNMRFQTVVPTATPWLAFVGGGQWGWASDKAHGPLIFFGGIIPIVPLNNALDNWVSFSFDPLGVTSGPGSKGTNIVLEGAAVVNLGAKMMPTAPLFKTLGAYFLLDQQLTNLPIDPNGQRVHWRPALVYGLFVQVAPWPT